MNQEWVFCPGPTSALPGLAVGLRVCGSDSNQRWDRVECALGSCRSYA